MSEHSVLERPDPLAFDSTQTLRTITLAEIQDANQQRWFAIQLAVSDRPVNLETMPRLDVFSAYRLYALAGRQGAATRHALRLGFFSEEQSAQTICGYLKTFFRSPSVVRVSAAEHARFEKSPRPIAPPLQTTSVRPQASAPPPAPKVEALDSARAKAETKSSPPASVTALKPASQKITKKGKSLAQELLEEARQVELSKSGKYREPKPRSSWLARLLGRSND